MMCLGKLKAVNQPRLDFSKYDDGLEVARANHKLSPDGKHEELEVEEEQPPQGVCCCSSQLLVMMSFASVSSS